ncbi:hypothetical protein BSKO_01259 [Bryopsis sp. KO-2023]|nr:hypothetical protein BSKO_01259 [Bryopsis sp. KO-2023]
MFRRGRLRRLITAFAVSAAGTAAVTYAYRWWCNAQEDADGDAVKSWLKEWMKTDAEEEGNSRQGQHISGQEEELLRREEESLLRHFENIENITDRIHFPRMVPSLAEALFKADAVEVLREQIRAASMSSRPNRDQLASPEERMKLWGSLIEASFTRYVASCWLLPMSFLITRVVLELMGRSMYMGLAADHIHQDLTPAGRRRNPLPPLFTKECQSRLLGLLELVPDFAVSNLVPHVREAVISEVRDIDMKEPCSLEDLLNPISRMNEKLEAAILTLPLANALGKEKVVAMESVQGSPSLLEPHFWSEADLVDNIVEEARCILDDHSFRATLVASARAFTQYSLTQVSVFFHGPAPSAESKATPPASRESSQASDSGEGRSSVEESGGGNAEPSKDESGEVSDPVQTDSSASNQVQSEQSLEATDVDGGVKEPVVIPFARCATLVAKLSKGWFEPGRSGIEVVSSLGVVHDFCLEVYTSNTVPD